LRLDPQVIGYIADHAGDDVVIVDPTLVPLLAQVLPHAPSIRHIIVTAGEDETDFVPPAELVAHGRPVHSYEALLAAQPDSFDWPEVEERSAAAMCYTSGTTGHPKGVVYSHRSMHLHSMAVCMNGVFGMSDADRVLPVVPMFHANAWGYPHMAANAGAKLVFPGPRVDAESIVDLMSRERVTRLAGVPTVWLGILALLDANPNKWDLSCVKEMIVGGAAAPAALIEGLGRHGLVVTQAWGMTEMNPIGTLARPKADMDARSDAEKLAIRAMQGYAVPFVETRHVGEDGQVLPWDGERMGELEVRGPFVASSYMGDEGTDRWRADGWFRTGDVVTIDAGGYVRICDRSKDVIKSGGEWISSVALENALMGHPSVLEAAVFAGRHAKWDERPIAAVVLKKGAAATEAELAKHLEGKFARFWMPDAYVFIEQIPRTSTGKFLKSKLRELYGAMLMK